MKKLDIDVWEQRQWAMGSKINEAIDLINSHSEAIERLRDDTFIEFEKVKHALQDHYRDPKAHEPTDDKLLVNKAVEKALQRFAEMKYNEPTDDKPEYKLSDPPIGSPNPDDTHRTVTLRIPKDMTVGEAITEAWYEDNRWIEASDWLEYVSDTDLQAAIDKITEEKAE
jgi:hypothetical protein